MLFNLIILFSICCGDAHKILLVFPFPIRSMNILGAGFARHLSQAGHEVTYVTAYPIKGELYSKFRQIDVSKNVQVFSADSYMNITSILENHDMISTIDVQGMQEYGLYIAEAAFQNDDFKKLLEDPNEKFDVVIADLYETEIYNGLSFVYDCPMIWSSSMGVQWSTLRLIDEPTNPSYTSDYMSLNVPPLDFTQRVDELWTQAKGYYIKEFITVPKSEVAFRKIFEQLANKFGKILPRYKELMYNSSLIFGNEQAVGNTPSLPQNYKFVGGQHIENPTKQLPKDLQSLMDNAQEGVIYFSLGSIWKSKDIPKPIKQGLLKIFGELEQTVIWKYEDDDLQPLPKNLHILKWAPQTSILNHPNCLIFITHGGLLSSIESLNFGVPIIGIPIFLDQFVNINRASKFGYAIKVDLSYNLPENLKSAIDAMLRDYSLFSKRVKELSTIFHDQPLAPGKELVHWVEHVIKTRGALHLRSPALYVPWYQKIYLDLVLFVIAVISVLILLIKRLFHARLFKQRNNLVQKKRQ